MTNQAYRLVLGCILLLSLYFDAMPILDSLIGMLVIEGVSNRLLPNVISKFRFHRECDTNEGSLGLPFKCRTSVTAERAWRFMVASMLVVGLIVFPKSMWFFPWFMAFAIFGAGISGVCPMYLFLKQCGFR